MTTDHQIKSVLEALNTAWAAGNADAVTECFTVDGVYSSSVGVLSAQRAIGRDEIRKLVASMMQHDDIDQSHTSGLKIFDQCAFWIWRYDFKNGQSVSGCDFFEFEKGLIALKDAYRKTVIRTPPNYLLSPL